MVKFNWKKKAAKALVFAMVMGTVGVHGVSLKSPVAVMAEGAGETKGESKAPSIEVQYDMFQANITSNNSDNYLFLEVLKDEKGDKGVSATYCFETNGEAAVSVDLSFLKITKVSYLRAYGDKDMTEKSDSVTVNAQAGKESIKYVAGSDDILKSFTIGGSNPKAEDLASYNVRTLYGSYVNLVTKTEEGDTAKYTVNNEILEQLRITGTTLIFQKQAVEEDEENKVAGAPAGPEIKVKVAAIAKAPKLTVDYLKGTVKLNKGTEYSLVGATKEVGEGDDKTTEQVWVDCANGGSLTPVEIIVAVKGLKDEGEGENKKTAEDQAKELLAEGVTLMVRTKAVPDKKKSASQPAFLTLKAAPSIEDDFEKGRVSVQDFAEDKEADKYLTYKNTEKGVELKPEKVSFDYSVDGGEKWKTVKVGATATVKGYTTFMVRTSGVKADAKNNEEGVLPSEAISVKVAALTPTYKDLVVTASKGNTLTFSANPGDSKYKATVAGSAKYQYKNADGEYVDIPSDGLAAGDYEIIVAATDDCRASAAVKVTLSAIAAPTEAAK